MSVLRALLPLLVLTACSAGLPPLQPQSRPGLESDEAGYWHLAERAEAAPKEAPTLIRDPALNRYISSVACKVAGPYCADIRVYLVRAPGLNAQMLPNGVMRIQSGLLLRLRDEAQLAGVIGHELGHYVERHLYNRAWQARVGADIRAWITVLGHSLGAGGGDADAELLAQAQLLAFSRQQEREADVFGLKQMLTAGYAPSAAAEVWNLAAAERGERRRSAVNRLLETHPAPAERRDALEKAAAAIVAPPATRGYVRYQAALAPHRAAFLADEVRLRLPTETLRLFGQLRAQHGLDATLAFYWGEVYRLRGWKEDDDQALKFLTLSQELPRAPAAAHRSKGLIWRAQGKWGAAAGAFRQYLVAASDAADAAMVRAYLAEMAGK